jgi:putative FmdB family regulatory protein
MKRLRSTANSTPCFLTPASCAIKGDMPIYEYSCAKCGATFEIIQKMSDKPLKTHAGCGGKVTKLISAAGFQFKGTGWYVTDYARKSSPETSDTTKDEKKETTTAAKETSSNGSSEKSQTSEKPAGRGSGSGSGSGKKEKSPAKKE